MTQLPQIPDAETRRRNVERLRESNRQLDLFGLALDELIAMAEAERKPAAPAASGGQVQA